MSSNIADDQFLTKVSVRPCKFTGEIIEALASGPLGHTETSLSSFPPPGFLFPLLAAKLTLEVPWNAALKFTSLDLVAHFSGNQAPRNAHIYIYTFYF